MWLKIIIRNHIYNLLNVFVFFLTLVKTNSIYNHNYHIKSNIITCNSIGNNYQNLQPVADLRRGLLAIGQFLFYFFFVLLHFQNVAENMEKYKNDVCQIKMVVLFISPNIINH